MSFKTEVVQMLNDLSAIAAARPATAHLSYDILQLGERLNEPLRVAVAGMIKAGKSTLINALLQNKWAVTGNLETTYNVSWFRYADTGYCKVVFEDHSSMEISLDEWRKWSVRETGTSSGFNKEVKHLEIYLPVNTLKELELIDTPGLNSIYRTDSANSLNALGVGGKLDTHERNSLREASIADALIYVVNKPAGVEDQQFLLQFNGGQYGVISAINSIAVLTQVDLNEGEATLEANMQKARARLKLKMTSKTVSSMLYTFLPVMGKPVEGLGLLQNSDWEALSALSGIDPIALAKAMRNKSVFVSRPGLEISQSVPAEPTRERLADLLTLAGIDYVISMLKSGADRDEIASSLFIDSGVADLKNVLVNHFTRRSLIIKVRYIFSRLQTIINAVEKKAGSGVVDVIVQMRETLKAAQNKMHIFRELEALQGYYNGLLSFGKNESEFLQILGESGITCEQRLGVEGSAMRIADLLSLARAKSMKWRTMLNQPMLWTSHQLNATRIILRTLDSIISDLARLNGE